MGQVRNDKILQRIALVLKDLRDEYGLSQEAVYNDTNIHIGRIEAGQSNPSISTISELASYFNLKMSEFFEKVEGKPKRR